MSAPLGIPPRVLTIKQTLDEDPEQFQLVQLVRLCSLLGDLIDPLGPDGDPDLSDLKMHNDLRSAFHCAEVSALEPDLGGTRRVVTSVLNMAGTLGVLPHGITHGLMKDADTPAGAAVRAALDRLTHRLIAAWHRSWSRGWPFAAERWMHALHAGREAATVTALWQLDEVAARAIDLLGWDPLESYPSHEDLVVLEHVALFALPSRPAWALQSLLVDYFGGVPVRIEPFRPRWVALEAQGSTVMDADHASSLALDRAGRFRVVIGPLDRRPFQAFLPDGQALPPLARLVRRFVGPALEFDVQVILRAGEILETPLNDPSTRLDSSLVTARAAGAPRTELTVLLDADLCRQAEAAFSVNSPARRAPESDEQPERTSVRRRTAKSTFGVRPCQKP